METKVKTQTCESVGAVYIYIYIYIGYSFIKHGICELIKNTKNLIIKIKDSDKSQNKNGLLCHCLFGVKNRGGVVYE